MTLKLIIEALLFASQKPMQPKEFVAALKSAAEGTEDLDVKALAKTKDAEVAAMLEELKIEFIESHRAFQLVEQANGWKLATSPEYGRWVRQLYPESKPARLSGPALETLAIIAYRQPITRADMEAVRGVAVDGVVQSLLERGLIRIAGRAEVPGRPLLYDTTEFFLEHFGLRTLDELPNSDELRRAVLPTAPVASEQPVAEQMTLGETAPDKTPGEPDETAKPADSLPEADAVGTGLETDN